MTDLLQVILLGIIEGITEFLPISSTGHLLIAEKLGLGMRSDVFNVVIQAGAILAVTVLYWPRLWKLASEWNKPENRDYILKLLVAFLITGVLGLIITKLGFKLPTEITPIAWALVIGGVWMIVAERMAANRPESSQITWKVAILVGLAQVVAAMFPGTSRSAATIFVAMLAGTNNRPAATEFAFLVGIPTMFAASGKLLWDTFKDGGGAGAENWGELGIAFVVSTITAFVAVKWLLRYIQTHRFTVFAWYRIVLGAGLLLFAH
ncbi:undecaprenyl-diphosphate phosphatase [Stenotrophobium rhamnosiphilum]|uniref:Undecaprenyl-diphosphatase n=1 Tax=Stenotrophobium rhamnosiphilum TaxID=2029166 RepID=A0A2T5MF69_9GAMM|nr:undecaprenyl-diphosphate phosphatase [Stenotrophobium rhamnosiphilum]PTU31206.1 undecaprenyl-diphosphate phosphatase [Stenotrophobium rhamnosiphilum]